VYSTRTEYIVKEKRGKPDRKPYPLPFGLRNPYENLKSENSQDYAQKPQRNCTFMNSALGVNPGVFVYMQTFSLGLQTNPGSCHRWLTFIKMKENIDIEFAAFINN
jgi:hypothetical protein